MGKLNENQILGITIGVFVLIAGGVLGCAYWLWEKNYKVELAKKGVLEKEIAALEVKKAELAKNRAELEELKKKEAEFAEILPSPDEVSRGEFLTMLSGFERQAQVLVSNVTQVASTAGGAPGGGAPGAAGAAAKPRLPFETVEFKFTVKGGFFEVVHFMYLVESYKRIMKINDGDITPDAGGRSVAGEKGDAPQRTPVVLNVKVATFVYSAPKTGGK